MTGASGSTGETGATGPTDHDQLTNRADADNHLQYALLNGTRDFTGDVRIDGNPSAAFDKSLTINSGSSAEARIDLRNGNLLSASIDASRLTDEFRILRQGSTPVLVIDTLGSKFSTTQLYLDGDGDLGINTTNPLGELDVAGVFGIKANAIIRGDMTLTYSGNNAILINSSNNLEARVELQGASTTSWTVARKADGNFAVRGNDGNNEPFLIEDGAATDSIVVKSFGSVGIGISLPAAKLDVNGTVKSTGLQCVGAASVGSNLTVAGDCTANTLQANASLRIPTGQITNTGALVIDSIFESVVQVGMLLPTAGPSTPSGWLQASGQAVDRGVYADLYDEIGDTYGPGDGFSTFNVPNMDGRAAVGQLGADPDFGTLGQTGGVKTVAMTEAEMPAHKHYGFGEIQAFEFGTLGGGPHNPPGGWEGSNGGFDNDNFLYGTTTVGGGEAIDSAAAPHDGDPHTNLQPYIAVRWLIKT
jgi:microcystin-dependent protein